MNPFTFTRACCCVLVAVVFFSTGVTDGSAQDCVPKPAGMIGWWRGEGDVSDFYGGISGVPVGDVAFGSGKVGQTFRFDGTTDGVMLGNPASLQLQNFSIEAWVKRSSLTQVSSSWDGGAVFGYGYGGFILGLMDEGRVFLSKVQISAVTSTNRVADTNWHHLAVTKSGGLVVIYIDGVAEVMPSYDPGFTFATDAAIGIRSDESSASFLGSIDEVGFYNRALSAAEVQAIYAAGSAGKCITPAAPVIVGQPVNRTVAATGQTTFSVVALGDEPLSYEWRFFETNILSQGSASLGLFNVQLNQAGEYTVVVSNPFGATTSSVATLTVTAPPVCVVPPQGLISWWRAAGDTNDSVTGNHGSLAGDAAFDLGRVGLGLVLDGNGDGVQLGNPATLRMQDFTIEAWVRRASDSQVSLSAGGGLVFSHGQGGFGFGLRESGQLFLTRVGLTEVSSSLTIADTNFHHIAVTKSGSVVVFYLDGVSHLAPAYSTTFNFTAGAAIGARGDNLGNSFLGDIDELSIYSRALGPAEIQSLYDASGGGKCQLPVKPSIVAQPAATNVSVGTDATFTVVAGGSPLLSYQWRLNGMNIFGATNTSLTVSNAQFASVGLYSVVITNEVGLITSSNAVLNVAFPPASVRLLASNAMAGTSIVVPVTLAANGNENSFGFSLSYSTQRLAYAGIALGSGAAGANLFVNTSMTSTGRLGIAVVLPAPSTFLPGTQEMVRVTFNTLPLLGVQTATTTVSFADQPVLRELSDSQLQSLAASYFNSTFILAPTVFEGDVSPRTNGNQGVSVTDWLQTGRFVARLDSVASTNEFRRADNAPRLSLGDAQLKVTDWVQAGRYLAGADPLVAVGGPSIETNASVAGPSANRRLVVVNTNASAGQIVPVSVVLEAQGDENAVGFTLTYNPTALSFAGIAPGDDAVVANFMVNTNQIGSGRVGVILALNHGTAYPAGLLNLVNVHFATATATGIFPVTLTDQIATRCVSDATASELPASFVGGSITVLATNAQPTLSIIRSNNNVILSWEAWANQFTLQTAPALSGSGNGWTNVIGTPQPSGDAVQLALPVTNQAQFFRLQR